MEIKMCKISICQNRRSYPLEYLIIDFVKERMI